MVAHFSCTINKDIEDYLKNPIGGILSLLLLVVVFS